MRFNHCLTSAFAAALLSAVPAQAVTLKWGRRTTS